MMGRGDWLKLETQINAVIGPLFERVAALEAKVAALEEAKERTQVPQKAQKA